MNTENWLLTSTNVHKCQESIGVTSRPHQGVALKISQVQPVATTESTTSQTHPKVKIVFSSSFHLVKRNPQSATSAIPGWLVCSLVILGFD